VIILGQAENDTHEVHLFAALSAFRPKLPPQWSFTVGWLVRYPLMTFYSCGLNQERIEVARGRRNQSAYSMTSAIKSSRNNFDLIRLIAATQVALGHAIAHLDPHQALLQALIDVIVYLPGVPVFFFVSGYLIYGSYSNIEHHSQTHRLAIFFTNRALRLYPALIVCFLVSLVAIYLSGYFGTVEFTPAQFTAWALASLTFFQFYTPDFLRGYGAGVPNGSLWTISVELQFYLLTPLIYVLFRKYRKSAAALFLLFTVLNWGNAFLNPKADVGQKLINVSFAPWIYMFLIGAYASTNKALQDWVLSVNGWLLIILYGGVYYLSGRFNLGITNDINLIAFLLLSALVLKMAYTKPDLSYKLLGKNDISYGVYIYHYPIVNVLLTKNFAGSALSIPATMVLTAVFAFASWKLIERPALNLKKIALRRY